VVLLRLARFVAHQLLRIALALGLLLGTVAVVIWVTGWRPQVENPDPRAAVRAASVCPPEGSPERFYPGEALERFAAPGGGRSATGRATQALVAAGVAPISCAPQPETYRLVTLDASGVAEIVTLSADAPGVAGWTVRATRVRTAGASGAPIAGDERRRPVSEAAAESFLGGLAESGFWSSAPIAPASAEAPGPRAVHLLEGRRGTGYRMVMADEDRRLARPIQLLVRLGGLPATE